MTTEIEEAGTTPSLPVSLLSLAVVPHVAPIRLETPGMSTDSGTGTERKHWQTEGALESESESARFFQLATFGPGGTIN